MAIRLIAGRRSLHRHNPDPTGPTPDGPLPATGSVAALISRATAVEPYFVGKPNPLMMRSALNAIDAHSEASAMVGDRMDTDIVSGLEAGMHTVLVLTGITSRTEAERFPYLPVPDRGLDRGPSRQKRTQVTNRMPGRSTPGEFSKPGGGRRASLVSRLHGLEAGHRAGRVA